MTVLEKLDAVDSRAVSRFVEYIRMKTVHPNPTEGYNEMEELLKKYAEENEWKFERLELHQGHPMYIVSWIGSDPTLKSIILYSHSDVVPVDQEKWTKDPWGGVIEDGKIYGRGTQDMKSVGIQYLEAMARLKASGYVPPRTVHALFVPDEEVGGGRGIRLLLLDSKMKELNPCFLLDEGLANPGPEYSLFYGERKLWWVRVQATGAAGHGSRFVQGTAVARLLTFLDRVMEYRRGQEAELEAKCGCGKSLGDVTSMNVTMLQAGEADPSRPQYNVIPTSAQAGIDIRVPATASLTELRDRLDSWAKEANEAHPGPGGVTWEALPGPSGAGQEAYSNPITPVEGPDAHWYTVFQSACNKAGVPLAPPSIFPAATDSRWIRMILNLPCFGFSPMRNTPILLHDHDEFVGVDVFLEGIQVYERILPEILEAKVEGA